MVDNIVFAVRIKIGEWLEQAGVEAPVVHLERASDPKFGEFASNVALRYAKQLKEKPLLSAAAIAEALNRSDIKGLAAAEAVEPGFVNIRLTTAAKYEHATGVVQAGAAYGTNTHYAEEKWVVEHTSPNPNKAMHLGHLRNNLVGMGIVRLLQASGAEVVSDNIYNDRGIAIAKVMYGFLVAKRKDEATPTTPEAWQQTPEAWHSPDSLEQKPDIFVTECYVAGEAAMQEEGVEDTVRQLVIAWEAADETVWHLWRHVLSIAYTGIDRTLTRLGNHWDKVWYEHEHYQKGKLYVVQGLEKGVFEKTEDGAVVTKLESEYGISDTVVLKRDGTSLYITQDIALTDLKKQTYEADKLVWVVGPEQSLAFQQLFAVCEQLGIGAREDFTHVTYGYVGLKDTDGSFKKMSSRAGTVVLIDDVIDTVRDTIQKRLETEEKYHATDVTSLAETLALGAVKFAFLRSDRTQDMSFDIEHSVNVQGDSGMYVLYSYVRTQSILRKATMAEAESAAPSELGAESETLRTLLYYPTVVEKATADLSVHHIAQYLLELCSAFNSWYAAEVFLDGTAAEAHRLDVVRAVAQTIENGLALLGIDTVEEI